MVKSRKKLSEKIHAALAEEILSGKLGIGSRIDEQLIVERFKVSRTPAREALLQLSSEGLVELVPRRGAIVKSISTRDYICMLEVLVALESLAARLCARRISIEQKEQMMAALEQCRTAAQNSDPAAYHDANKLFHDALYTGAHNEILAKEIRRIRKRLAAARRQQLFSTARMRSSTLEHEKVFKAILAGDEQAADTAMQNHISAGGNVFADAIASLSQE
jgi:DNA-binding GntR family transcriptional regulator